DILGGQEQQQQKKQIYQKIIKVTQIQLDNENNYIYQINFIGHNSYAFLKEDKLQIYSKKPIDQKYKKNKTYIKSLQIANEISEGKYTYEENQKFNLLNNDNYQEIQENIHNNSFTTQSNNIKNTLNSSTSMITRIMDSFEHLSHHEEILEEQIIEEKKGNLQKKKLIQKKKLKIKSNQEKNQKFQYIVTSFEFYLIQLKIKY
ncbi:hypothetical protein IMG5_013010, partial [Ichthyophthirius multifiliis]